MISINIRDYRGCEFADIECAPLALVAGRNAVGKSSIAGALAAILSSEAVPPGIKKGSAAALVRAGAKNAIVKIRDDNGAASLDWPACAALHSGQAPHADEFATGIQSLVDLDIKERARLLSDRLGAEPTAEELAQALKDAELAGKYLEPLRMNIETHGWDGAHTKAAETGAELKGRWQQVTGANYGKRLAQDWVPEGWDNGLRPLGEHTLLQRAEDARAELEKAIGATAVLSSNYEALKAEAGEHAAAEEAEKQAVQRLTQVRAARAALPAVNQTTPMPCPHCGGRLVLRRKDSAALALEKAPDDELLQAKELKQRREAIAGADGEIANAEAEHTKAREWVRRSNEAAAALLKARPPTDASVDREAARLAADDAQNRLKAYRAKTAAAGLVAKINENDKVLEILAPTGLRARKLLKTLDLLNKEFFAPVCEAAAWKPVSVAEDMTLAYGGRAYPLLSASEQYRVRVTTQVALARLSDASMLVIDGADILDAQSRSGLFALLTNVGIPALICMTLPRRDTVPDLAALGCGHSYWIENGIAERIGADKAEAAE